MTRKATNWAFSVLLFYCYSHIMNILLLFTYNEYTIQKQHRVSQEGMNRESLSHLS